MKWPKKLFVRVENEGGDDQYFEVSKDANGLSSDGECAIYELKEVGTANTSTTYLTKRKVKK